MKLFYNDYNTFQPSKTQAILKLAAHLKERGLIDGIGMQGIHGPQLSRNRRRAGQLQGGAPALRRAWIGDPRHRVSIRTPDESAASFRRQAERYEDVFRVLTEVSTAGGGPANITSVTVFGLMDHYLFYPNDNTTTRLFDGNLQPKPAFYSVREVGERARSNR